MSVRAGPRQHRHIIGAGIDTWWLAQLPIQLAIPVAVKLLVMNDELAADVEHTIRNTIRNPHGTVVSEVSGSFRIQGTGAREDWLTGIVLPTVVQFEALEEGAYSFEHAVDDASAQIAIHIVHGPPPGAGPPV